MASALDTTARMERAARRVRLQCWLDEGDRGRASSRWPTATGTRASVRPEGVQFGGTRTSGPVCGRLGRAPVRKDYRIGGSTGPLIGSRRRSQNGPRACATGPSVFPPAYEGS